MAAWFHALAHDVISRRDGYAGWQRHRDDFRALAAGDAEGVRRQSSERLRRLLAHAYATVPFYRNAWDAAGVVPPADATAGDLRRLPVLTKADVRDRKAALVSCAVPAASRHVDYTGGTTGTQTSFYRDHGCRAARFGRQWGVLERCGYRPGDRRALIWGAHADLTPPGPVSLKQWIRNRVSADRAICCTVMSGDDMRAYHAQLLAFRPAVIYGYPNAIEQFARYADQGLPPLRVARVFCTAERLHQRQRALFQRVFGGEVFNLYCSREHGCVAFECGRHDRFHVDAGSALVEILRDGRPAAPGESGQIVVTDLLNYGMPFIRYATGDVATAAGGPCPCGCPLPTFSRLDGRSADTLYRPDGSAVAGLMLDDLFMDLPAITHAQFVQHDVSSLDVNVVLKPGAGDLAAAMIAEVGSIMGPGVRVRIHVVDDIPRHPRSGKYREVICKVPACS